MLNPSDWKNTKTRSLRHIINKFFDRKYNKYFKNKIPVAKCYPYRTIDPYTVLGESSGFESFYLVGDNWKKTEKKPIAILWGFNDWKLGFVSNYLPEYRTAFAPRKILGIKSLFSLRKLSEKPEVFIVWGFTERTLVRNYSKTHKIPIFRMEDGFIRSSRLGASHSTPYSLVLDRSGLHYNCSEPSDLENILNTYDFQANPELIRQAEESRKLIIELNLSKYNSPELIPEGINSIIKTKRRIAVLGQVDGDASMKFGNPDNWTSEMLVKLAKFENQEAEVIYRPHPEVFKGYQKSRFKKKRVKNLATIASPDEPLLDFLLSVDHVYTITSLAGFEALIRGIKVTCVGIPFYSGWGLTNDRIKTKRRTALLTLTEIFAGAYLLYPRYLANFNSSFIGLNAACYKINADREIELDKESTNLISNRPQIETPITDQTYWLKLLFTRTELECSEASEILAGINYSNMFDSSEDASFYQTVIIFLISGVLPNNHTRNLFINHIRPYVDHSILNELLVYLSRFFPGEYISSHISWLLHEHNQSDLAISYLRKEAQSIRQIQTHPTNENRTLLDKNSASYPPKSLTFLPEECEVWIELLKRQIEDKDFEEAIKILKPLLLSNYSILKLLKLSLSLAELQFNYRSAIKISHLSQKISLYFGNRLAIMSELRASMYIPLDSKIQHLCLLAKILTLKPDMISSTLTSINNLPEFSRDTYIKDITVGILSLDNEISIRKVKAYLAIERYEYAEKIVSEIIELGNCSDTIRVLYSQTLSYNGKLQDALEVMDIARNKKVTSANLHESLRLCVITSNYRLSLELLDLAKESRIVLGDMHKRKAYFGNRMIKEALETFTEIRLVKTVAKYYGEKYYKFESNLEPNESAVALAIFGPGDEIRFASIYNLIINHIKTTDLTISCSPRLLVLFTRSFPSLKFIPVDRPRNSDKIDLDNYSDVPGSDILGVIDNRAVEAINKSDRLLFVTDLLHRCLPDYNAFPGISYLTADEDKILKYKQRLPADTLIVGLSWRSSLTTHSRNEHYLEIDELEPLFTIPGVIFLNLQYDECDAELEWIYNRYPNKMINFEDIDQYNDFDSVAALMKCTDLIISTASTVVELAGALGCSTWLFSNSSELDWRKSNDLGTDVWHKNTTIIEGETLGDKATLVKALYTRLVSFSKRNDKLKVA